MPPRVLDETPEGDSQEHAATQLAAAVVEVKPEAASAEPIASAAPAAPKSSTLHAAGLAPELLQAWARVVRASSTQPTTRAILTNLEPVGADESRLMLRGEERYTGPARSRLAALAELLHKELGRRLEITLVEAGDGQTFAAPPAAAPSARLPQAPPVSQPQTEPENGTYSDNAPHPDAPAAVDPAQPSDPQPSTLAANHPIVRQTIELFGARIVSVQPRPG